jgi:hypothetical protein
VTGSSWKGTSGRSGKTPHDRERRHESRISPRTGGAPRSPAAKRSRAPRMLLRLRVRAFAIGLAVIVTRGVGARPPERHDEG